MDSGQRLPEDDARIGIGLVRLNGGLSAAPGLFVPSGQQINRCGSKLRGAVFGLEFGECQPRVRRQGRLARSRGGVGQLLDDVDRCRRQRSGASVFERRLAVLPGADQPITVSQISRDAFPLVFLTTCRDEEEQCRREADG